LTSKKLVIYTPVIEIIFFKIFFLILKISEISSDFFAVMFTNLTKMLMASFKNILKRDSMSLLEWPEGLNELVTVARSSPLSQVQFKEIKSLIHHFYPQTKFKAYFTQTQGDIDKTSSLKTVDCPDFFTDTLDRLLLEKKAHLAIHSAKDLPLILSPGLHLAAITPCIDPRDVLVFSSRIDLLKPLPKNLRVATSSVRREEAVRVILPSPAFQDLRGTIQERLNLLNQNQADAVVVAEAALIRLNLTHLPRIYLKSQTQEGQGSLALVTHCEQTDLIAALACLDTRQKRPLCLYLGLDSQNYSSSFSLVHSPAIRTHNLLEGNLSFQKQLIDHFYQSSHVLITSPRSAKYLWQLLEKNQLLEQASEKIWLCLGKASAKPLGKQASQQILCDDRAIAEDLIPWIYNLHSDHFVLYPHSLHARPVLKSVLQDLVIPHADHSIYYTSKSSLDGFRKSIVEADELIFTSPTCVQSFFTQIGQLPKAKLTAIGEITLSELQKYLSDSYTLNRTLAYI
jgi:hydroxymethylbilane synthase